MKLRFLLVVICLAVSMIPIGIIGGFQGFEMFTMVLIGLILIVTFFVSLVMSYFITYPIEKLTKNIDRISKGDLDVALEKSEIYELNNLTQSLNRVMISLKLAIHKVGVKKGEIFEETIKAKEEAEEKYQDLLKTIDVWVWETDAKGVYTYCSAKIADTLGYSPEEVIGKTIFEFMPPEEAKKAKAIFREHCKKHAPLENFENYCIHKDGHGVCVFMNATPVFDHDGNFTGFRGVQRDVTTHKQSEQLIETLIQKNIKLKEMKEEKVSDSVSVPKIQKSVIQVERDYEDKRLEKEFDSVFIFNEKAHVVDCNKNMYEQLGYTKGEMLELNVVDFDVFETYQSIKEKINKIKKTGSLVQKTIHKRKDGSSVFVSEYIEYIKDENKFKCFIREDSP